MNSASLSVILLGISVWLTGSTFRSFNSYWSFYYVLLNDRWISFLVYKEILNDEEIIRSEKAKIKWVLVQNKHVVKLLMGSSILSYGYIYQISEIEWMKSSDWSLPLSTIFLRDRCFICLAKHNCGINCFPVVFPH